MKFTIRALFFLTFMVAMSAYAVLQRNRIARVKTEIQEIQSETNRLDFDAAYVHSHTQVCELAIANNPLPSPYYIAAQQRHEELFAARQESTQ